MTLENYHLAHTTVYNCGRAESTKDATIRECPKVEKQDICIISRYLPKAILSVTKGNTVTLQWRNLGVNALTHDHKLPAPGVRHKDVPLRGASEGCAGKNGPSLLCRVLAQHARPQANQGKTSEKPKWWGGLQNNWTGLSKCQIMKDNEKLRTWPRLEKTRNSGWLNATCQGPGPIKGHWRSWKSEV